MGIAVALMTVSAIPVLVSLTNVTQANAKAEEEKVVVSAPNSSEEEIEVSEAPIEE